MKMFKALCVIGSVVACIYGSSVSAKVSPEEAARLGGGLTPVGAEKAGNIAGTIPEWNGGLTTPPEGFTKGAYNIDPFAKDPVLFTITKDNMQEYSANLTEGQKALLNLYASYKIPVYQSRRTAALPKEIYAAAKRNAVNVELLDQGNGVSEYELAVPFPIPKSAKEVIWNHLVRYRGGKGARVVGQVTPTKSGEFTVIMFKEEVVWRTSLTDFKTLKPSSKNTQFYYKQSIISPARLAGSVLLVHETLNQVKGPRKAWLYNSAQRRVRRAPQVSYDSPAEASDSLKVSDNFDMYNGAPDRYDWKLIGKQELYIPYNAYKIDSRDIKYKDIVKPGHINMDFTRYELHRVWKVEATLREDSRHIYAKRVFYIDEDSWQIAEADHYDGRGELWRVSEAHLAQFYDVDTPWNTMEVTHDLLAGRYHAFGLDNEQPKAYDFSIKRSSKDFTPSALRRSGNR